MRIAYSIATSETIAAEHAEYGDCAKFQIVCPCCREAVFKGKREPPDKLPTHYFSHYNAGSDEARRCEIRVAALVRPYIQALLVGGHGQTLAQFMAVLRERVIRGQDELGVVVASVMRHDALAISCRPDIELLERPILRLLNSDSRVTEEDKGFNLRDYLAKTIGELRPF